MKFLALALPLVTATSAAAADSFSQNPHWSAWYGCWQAEGAPANELVCITPADGGVRVATLIGGAVRDESRIIADGGARAVQSVGCSGSERAHWSADRRRVFLESDVACGSTGRRTVRGMFAFVAPDAWISVQSATEGDSVATRIVRFTAADARSLPNTMASFAARTSVSDVWLDVDEAAVNEAVAQIGAEATQEWMRSAGEPFELGYQGQDRGNGSALEQVGRMSNPVVVREVVRVVERPVYVYDHYDYGYARWHYSPWGYHYHGWHWHRPVIYVRLPIVVFRNTHYRRDYWRYDRDRYGRYDYDRHRRDRYDIDRDNHGRYDNSRYDRDRNEGRNNESRGRLTRAGYSNGRDRSEPNGVRTDVPRATQERATPQRSVPVTRSATSRTTSRGSASPQRSTGSSRGTGTVSRTARPRSARD